MKYAEIVKNIKAGNFAPIYFLMGEETYHIDQLTKLIEKVALPEDQQSFNQTVLYGRDTDVNTIIGEAKRYPMMADRVVVIVREAQDIRMIENLEKYLENIQPTTVLVIAYKYKTIDKRKKLYKLLSNGHVVFESKKLYDNQIPDWIGSNLAQRGFNSSMKARVLLAESLGSDLGRIDSELEKLELVAEKGSTIDEQIVEDNIGISKDFNNFELITALGKKQLLKALTIQKYFAANPKDNPLVVTIGLLFGFFSKLMIVHQAQDKTPGGLAKLLGVNPYFVRDYQEGAVNYDLKKLARIISYLRECDVRSKGIRNATTADGELLKELIFKIIHA